MVYRAIPAAKDRGRSRPATREETRVKAEREQPFVVRRRVSNRAR